MLRAALALFVVAAVAWAGAMALGSAGADDAAPDGSELVYLWVSVTARDDEAQTLEVEVVDGELGGLYRHAGLLRAAHRRGRHQAGHHVGRLVRGQGADHAARDPLQH